MTTPNRLSQVIAWIVLCLSCGGVFWGARWVTALMVRSGEERRIGATPNAPSKIDSGIADTSQVIVAMVIVGSRCAFSQSEATLSVLRKLRSELGRVASSRGSRLEVIAADIDAPPAKGSVLLEQLPQSMFDQVVLGGGWDNEIVRRWIWNEGVGAPMVPQVIVLQRIRIHSAVPFDTRTLSEQHLISIHGVGDLEAWARQGFPLPSST